MSGGGGAWWPEGLNCAAAFPAAFAAAVAAIAASSGLAGSAVVVVFPPPQPEPEPEPEPAGIGCPAAAAPDQRVAADREALDGLVADSVGAAEAEEVRANLAAAAVFAGAFRLAAAGDTLPRRCNELGVAEVAPPFPPPAFAAAAAIAAAEASAAAAAAADLLAEVPAALATAAASLAALRSAAVCDGGLFGRAGGTSPAFPSRSSLMKYFWAWERTC